MAMKLITTNTLVSGDSASTASFTGIDNTYKLYVFKFYDVNPVTNAATLSINGSDDTSSHSYDIAKTTTFFRSINDEAAGGTAKIQYMTANDVANATGVANIVESIGNGADESCAGEMYLFNPSSTVYVTHFFVTTHSYHDSDFAASHYVSGYFNTTAAITAIQFTCSSNMDGVFKLYGVG